MPNNQLNPPHLLLFSSLCPPHILVISSLSPPHVLLISSASPPLIFISSSSVPHLLVISSGSPFHIILNPPQRSCDLETQRMVDSETQRVTVFRIFSSIHCLQCSAQFSILFYLLLPTGLCYPVHYSLYHLVCLILYKLQC